MIKYHCDICGKEADRHNNHLQVTQAFGEDLIDEEENHSRALIILNATITGSRMSHCITPDLCGGCSLAIFEKLHSQAVARLSGAQPHGQKL